MKRFLSGNIDELGFCHTKIEKLDTRVEVVGNTAANIEKYDVQFSIK